MATIKLSYHKELTSFSLTYTLKNLISPPPFPLSINLEVHPCLDKTIVLTMGEYLENLLIDLNYYGTRLPRIPVLIDRELKKKALMMSEKRARKLNNLKHIEDFQKGEKIMAIAPEVICEQRDIRFRLQ